MNNKINPYRRNAEVLRDFFRQPLSLLISIALTISFLTQTLLSVYSFFTIKEYIFNFIPFIYLLPIIAFMSLFIKTHKHARDFSPSPGLPLLSIYNVISILLILGFIVNLVSLYIIKFDEFLNIFNLQSNGIALAILFFIISLLIIPACFAITSLVFIHSIKKSFKSIYLFKGGSVAYSIFSLVCAGLTVGFLTFHFFNSTVEYRGTVYFFLTTTICVIEFITYILYTVFGFSYNSYIKRISMGITESKNEVQIFEPTPTNDNYKPLNMWDDSDKKKTKQFTPQNVFNQTNNETSISSEFDMWNENEKNKNKTEVISQEPVVKHEPVYNPVTHFPRPSFNSVPPKNDNFIPQNKTVEIKINPVFNKADLTEPKHNKFEDWNNEVKTKLENFDTNYTSTQKSPKSNPTVNIPGTNKTAPQNFTVLPVFTNEDESIDKLHKQNQPVYQPINIDPNYSPQNLNIAHDTNASTEFNPTNNSHRDNNVSPNFSNESFASVDLWDEPIMPKGRKKSNTPQVIIDHTSNINHSTTTPKKGDIDGNIYINTLLEAPIMNYGSNRIPINHYAENPYNEDFYANPTIKSKKAKKKKKDKKNKNFESYQQPSSHPIICPNCKSVCSSDVYFCVKCGTILK